MPVYEYLCSDCLKRHEIMQRITEKPLTKCPDCGGEIKKMISQTSFVLKGTGWYATDYARDKKKTDAGGKESGSEKAPEAKNPQTKETKTEKKPAAEKAAV